MNEFLRTEMLIGKEAMDKLRRSKVAVFGIGGVGSFAAEALARAGIGSLVLIDHDIVCITNINRQIHALHTTIGRPKAEVMMERVLDINPVCQVEAVIRRYSAETTETTEVADTVNELIKPDYDYIVDAVDDIAAKVDIAVNASRLGIPVISCMGTGNKLDPTMFEVADIYDTSICPLARSMRRELKKKSVASLKVVFSKEKPLTVRKPSSPVKRIVTASISFVSSTAGLILAGEVVKDLISGIQEKSPASADNTDR